VKVGLRAPLVGLAAGLGTWLIAGGAPLIFGVTGCASVLCACIIGPAVGFVVFGFVSSQVREAEDAKIKREELDDLQRERHKTLIKFQRLIEQLRPAWSLSQYSGGDYATVSLCATCRYDKETVGLAIVFDGIITDDGYLKLGREVSFSVESPSADTTLLRGGLSKVDDGFQWLAEYVRKSQPFLDLRQRKLNLKRGLGL
jgi:hypothetical protein